MSRDKRPGEVRNTKPGLTRNLVGESTMSQAKNSNITSPSRRRVLAGISVAAVPAVAAVDKSLGAIVPSVDPIFALIAEHRVAATAYAEAVYAEGALVPSPEYEAARIVTCETGDRAYDLLEELLNTQPTTLTGAAALLEHVGQPEFPREEGQPESRESRQTFLTSANEYGGGIKRTGQDFPVRLAETVRTLIAAA